MSKEIAIPLAYFITFTCYGTWLHGNKSTSVDKRCNTPNTNFLSSNYRRYNKEKELMAEDPYILEYKQRHIVLCTIEQACKHHQWTLLAAHVRTNHVHIVVHALTEPERIMSIVKAYASRNLNRSNLDKQRANRWTRHGSTRYLWHVENVESAIDYVINEQGEKMSYFENVERVFLVGV